MQRIICQGSRLPFLAALVATNSSLHFFNVNLSWFVRMGRYGEHKENSGHFKSSVVVLGGVWTMRLWSSVLILCKQRTTCEIYVKIRKMFLENSKMTHVAEISLIIPLYFALNQSNSPALLLVFLQSVASKANPLQKPAVCHFVPLMTKLKTVQWTSQSRDWPLQTCCLTYANGTLQIQDPSQQSTQ